VLNPIKLKKFLNNKNIKILTSDKSNSLIKNSNYKNKKTKKENKSRKCDK